MEKTKILDILLSGFNDGRKKPLFCTAVTLLDLQELWEVLRQIGNVDAQRKECFCRGITAGCGSKEQYKLEAMQEEVMI